MSTSSQYSSPRIKELSHSSTLTLHRCPREYQLDKSRESKELTEEQLQSSNSITLNYGTIVGDGIQALLIGTPLERVKFDSFLKWKPHMMSEDTKRNKSLWSALFALESFEHIRNSGFLEDWEVVSYKNKPACELSFRITLLDGYKYRGHVDVVLMNKITQKLLVLELKTTSMAVNPATYKNSSQGIGYSIVLDAIAPELSSYSVLYLVFETKHNVFTPLEFPKSYSERARWIMERVADVNMLEYFEEKNFYPIHGESCMRYGRECDYFGVCTLSDDKLFSIGSQKAEEKEYDIEISLQDLIDSQVRKSVPTLGLAKTGDEGNDIVSDANMELEDNLL
jgi:hypothetical protein